MSQDYPLEEMGSDETQEGEFDFENYYDLLGVDADAETDEILSAYRELVKEYHPDVSSLAEREAERRFEQLGQARTILEHPKKREAYDSLGHEKYLKQSEELGRHVRQSDRNEAQPGDGDTDEGDDHEGGSDPAAQASGSEPQPQPAQISNSERATSGNLGRESQTSVRGEAHKRGETIPGTPEKVFVERTRTPEHDEGESPESSQSAYQSLFSLSQELSTTSLHTIGERWGQSWRSRVLVTVGGVATVVAVSRGTPVVSSQLGVSVSAPSISVGWLFGLTLLIALATTIKTCLSHERNLPSGGFVDDRELTRFTFEKASTYRMRGYLYLSLPITLLITSVQVNGLHPWEYTARALRGNVSSGFPWFPLDIFGLSLGSYQSVLDVVLTVGFLCGALAGAVFLALGLSIDLWRRQFELGDRIHLSLWEPLLSGSLVALVFGVAVGTHTVGSVPGTDAMPPRVQTVLALSDGQVTVGSLAVVAIGLLVLLPLVYRLILAISSGSSEPELERG